MYNKKDVRYIDESDLFFSRIRGSGIYTWDATTDPDPTDVSGSRSCPVFLDIQTEELFLVKRIRWDKYERRCRRAVLHAAEAGPALFWPVDLISLRNFEQAGEYVEPTFGPKGKEAHASGDLAFLFPYRDYGVVKSAADEIEEIRRGSVPNWAEPRVRRLAARILEAYQSLNAFGYLNMDIDFRHFFITGEGKILLAYSHLMAESEKRNDTGFFMEEGCFPVEFAEPALMSRKRTHTDTDMQNYSLAALLFYLLLGRLPYDGPLVYGMDLGLIGNNADEHAENFRRYHENPVFLFDPLDQRNHLGDFSSHRKYMVSWEKLPEPVRRLFCGTLYQLNAERSDIRNKNTLEMLETLAGGPQGNEREKQAGKARRALRQADGAEVFSVQETGRIPNPTPEEWLYVFREAGWIGENERSPVLENPSGRKKEEGGEAKR